jgi:hypothetical protein
MSSTERIPGKEEGDGGGGGVGTPDFVTLFAIASWPGNVTSVLASLSLYRHIILIHRDSNATIDSINSIESYIFHPRL